LVGLGGNPIYTTIRRCFTRNGDFTWRVSDLWRISGGFSQEMIGWF